MSNLSRLAKILSRQNIDISHLVALTEYLEDENVMAMLETASFEDLDPALLDRLMPLLDRQSKGTILQKVMDGEMNAEAIRTRLPYADDMMIAQIESGVMEGAFPEEVLAMIREFQEKQLLSEMREKEQKQ